MDMWSMADASLVLLADILMSSHAEREESAGSEHMYE